MPGRSSWRWWQRMVAACLAVWFAVVTVDLPALHTCAMHGGPATASSAMTSHAAHAAQAGHTEHAAPAHQHACSCLGHCCATTAPAAPAALDLGVVAARLVPARATGRPDHEYVAAWVDFVLPFATAPPAATLG